MFFINISSIFVFSLFPDFAFGHTVNDTLMRFYTQCARLVQGVDKNASALIEIDRFNQGSEMKRVQEKIANQLRVPHSLISYGSNLIK